MTQVDAKRSGAVLRLYYGLGHLVRELLKFGIVGGIGLVIDVGLSNLCHLYFDLGPLTSKTIGSGVAIAVTFYGNREWTFRHRGGGRLHIEAVRFLAVSLIGFLITLAITGFSYYVLDQRGALAFNVAANGIGLLAGTAFRFWGYRRLVFPALVDEAVEQAEDEAEAVEHAGGGRPEQMGR
ncbi:GtrA family protein [Motilibacter deserti]|uniref:GtrA family protein n=1 Tax=Motilibacter deserti TaxID=2714956 RepID=A0ABX0GUS7_9ACTN|nr:GtrA family protein [Motilibacter deserti]